MVNCTVCAFYHNNFFFFKRAERIWLQRADLSPSWRRVGGQRRARTALAWHHAGAPHPSIHGIRSCHRTRDNGGGGGGSVTHRVPFLYSAKFVPLHESLTWMTFCNCLSLSTTKMSTSELSAMTWQAFGELVDKMPTEKPLEAEAKR